MSGLSENKAYDILNAEPDYVIPFNVDSNTLKEKQPFKRYEDVLNIKVHEAVNKILGNFGFEEFSKNQFKYVAGGSKYSANKIENYFEGRGKVKYGWTRAEDVVEYCLDRIKNSVFIERDTVVEWLKWSKEAVNQGYITPYSGGATRYDIQAFLDITKGHMPEEAFKKDMNQNFGCGAKLDRELYGDTLTTDEGSDVKEIKKPNSGDYRRPKLKVQIKDVQWFYLVSKSEFEGSRKADIYVGYKTHWPKTELGQKLLSYIDKEDIIFYSEPLEGVRVERRGWAWPGDFEELPAGERKKGQSFNHDNYFIFWNDLRKMSSFPTDRI